MMMSTFARAPAARPMGYFEALLAREVLEQRRRAEGSEDAYFGRCWWSRRGQLLGGEHGRQRLADPGAVTPVTAAISEMWPVQHVLGPAQICEFLLRGNR